MTVWLSRTEAKIDSWDTEKQEITFSVGNEKWLVVYDSIEIKPAGIQDLDEVCQPAEFIPIESIVR